MLIVMRRSLEQRSRVIVLSNIVQEAAAVSARYLCSQLGNTNRLGDLDELALARNDLRRNPVRPTVGRRVAMQSRAKLGVMINAVEHAGRMHLVTMAVALGVALRVALANPVEACVAPLPTANPAALLDPDPPAAALDLFALAHAHELGLANGLGDTHNLAAMTAKRKRTVNCMVDGGLLGGEAEAGASVSLC